MNIYNDSLSEYVTKLFANEDEALQIVRETTPKLGLPNISITPEEGRFLQVLVQACGANKALEIGTLGGYSGTWIARGLPPNGKLITLEIDERHAEVARNHFKLAGVDSKVDIRVGDAHQTLKTISTEGPFDFIFIDADKTGYVTYFEWALENVRPGGVITAHNIFRKGGILDDNSSDERIVATQALIRRVTAETSISSTVYPAGDGTLVSVKIS